MPEGKDGFLRQGGEERLYRYLMIFGLGEVSCFVCMLWFLFLFFEYVFCLLDFFVLMNLCIVVVTHFCILQGDLVVNPVVLECFVTAAKKKTLA